MFSSAVLVLPILGLVRGYDDKCVDNTLCIDGINGCGVRWGGCYNTCEPDKRPTMPPCDPTSTPYYTPTPTSTDDCSTRTICVDNINECGVMYGGCFPDCKPWPTFPVPPCDGPADACDKGEPVTLCVDYINECGMWYGGCHDVCSSPTPIYTPPPCPTTSGWVTKPSKSSSVTSAVPTGRDDICKDGEPHSICVDGIDDCGNGWGTCYDFCATTSLPIVTKPCTPTPTSSSYKA